MDAAGGEGAKRRRPTRRVVAALALILGCAVAASTVAWAAAPSTTSSTPAPDVPPGPAIWGVLDNSGAPVAGVRITVSRHGRVVGRATSDASGRFVIPLADAGVYSVTLDTKSVPKGVVLTDPERARLPEVTVFGGLASRVLFPFGRAKAATSRVSRFSNLAIGGLRLGLLIGVCAVGLSLIFGATGLVNFAHGELITFGALVAWFCNTGSGGPRWPLLVAAGVAVAAGGALGAVLQLGLFAPLVRRRSGSLSRMVVSIGLALLLRHVYLVVFNGTPRAYRQYAAQAPVHLGAIALPIRDWLVMGVCATTLIAVALVLERTRLGTAIRALADERDLAAASGIDVHDVVLRVWIAGAALSALGGVLLGVTETVSWDMGYALLLPMFAAVVLGGLGNAYGAMVGGLVIGMSQSLSTYWLPSDYQLVVALGILVVVLLVRPQGLLGLRERVG